MTKIYDQHDAAFQNVSAYVVMRGADRVATIAFKFPRDGAGRLYSYVHWIGLEMVRGRASGYGYDKRSAACSVAAKNLLATFQAPRKARERALALDAGFKEFTAALATDGGKIWDSELRDAGFTVWQAV